MISECTIFVSTGEGDVSLGMCGQAVCLCHANREPQQ